MFPGERMKLVIPAPLIILPLARYKLFHSLAFDIPILPILRSFHLSLSPIRTHDSDPRPLLLRGLDVSRHRAPSSRSLRGNLRQHPGLSGPTHWAVGGDRDLRGLSLHISTDQYHTI